MKSEAFQICSLLAGSLFFISCARPQPGVSATTVIPSGGKGYAMAIGLNHFSARTYGNEGKLQGCVHDATDMINIAKTQGFQTAPLLLNEDATRDKVVAAIRTAKSKLKSGDTFVLSYSGHGAQSYDTNGDERDDHRDETWCLYDGMMTDDKLAQLWSEFADGVRILVFSDSCFSGTVIKAYNEDGTINKDADPLTKALPEDLLTELRNRPENLSLDLRIPDEITSKSRTSAAVVLISGCDDDQKSQDGNRNGRFTGALRNIWGNGAFHGSLGKFHEDIKNSINDSNQTPNFDRTGDYNKRFEAQRPWTQ